ncbi:tripartite tricarboxylate transporter substrate binding protein [Verminephrobacter eiseniae]|nr:tripartite tricarboxylate transporter substrate binding protein [Verminephrobacter eiseniae]
MKERVRICRIYHKKHRRMPMVCQKIQHEDQPLIDFGDNMETTDATRRFFCLRLGAAAVGTALNSAHAALPAGYPAKPIRIVVPFPAGQGADASARALARELEAVLGQPLIIENRPGGNNVIGVKVVTNAAADGYTLFYGTNSPMAANAVFFRDLGYDPVKDFTPVAMFGRSRWVVVVSAESPIRSFADLVEASKRQTGGVSFAVGATGYQLAVILLANSSGLVANIVPYKGTPQAITDVIGQQVTATMSDFGTMRALIEAGKVRPILAFADRRIAAIPGVPSLKDLKLDIPTLFSWTALFAAAGTSSDIVNHLAEATSKALQSPAYKEYSAKNNSEIVFAGPAELAKFQRQEVEDYRHAMKVGNVEPQ